MGTDGPTNGVSKCVGCGSSDVSFDGSWLVCRYCHNRWNTSVLADELRPSERIDDVVGTWALAGAKNIDMSSLVTVKCDGCGAVVTINTDASLTDTCHWCRRTLSLNNPVDNGAVPDAILPFTISRKQAADLMAAYVFELLPKANPQFRSDFARYPIQAVYLPYLVVDGNVTVRLDGTGWVDKGMAKESPYPQECVYLTEEFSVARVVDLAIENLAIEARSTRTKLFAAVSTANIINAIQPFDIENAVRFSAHYVTDGVAFEKRDMDIHSAMAFAGDHFATIGRSYVNPTLSAYTGGVRWDEEHAHLDGSRWVGMLLPVWLYAFEEATPSGPMMHYIAVNGRTGETQGSVPVDWEGADRRAKTFKRSTIAVLATPLALVAFGACLAALAGLMDLGSLAMFAGIPLLLIAWAIAVGRDNGDLHRNDGLEGLRNPDARLMPEHEIKYTASEVTRFDKSLGEFTHLGGPEILERNDHAPHLRAAVFEIHADGGEGAPQLDTDADAGGTLAAPRPRRFTGRGQRVDGQAPSAPPQVGNGIEFLPE